MAADHSETCLNDACLNDPYVAASPENLPFWQAAAKGSFLGKACADCGRFHWYPRAICPFCSSANTEWRPLSGQGQVYAVSTLRRVSTPYTVAYVQLAEGPVVLSNLVDMGDAQMAIGMAVRVVFRATPEGRMAPKFTGMA